MSGTKSSGGGGIGIIGLLGVLFVGLKLGGVIDWSWWYVTVPFWGGFALAIAVFVVYIGVSVLSKAKNNAKRGWQIKTE